MYDKEFAKLFELAENKVDDIEIMLQHSRSFSVRVHQQKVDAFNYADNKGIGIRVLKEGKTGYSYTEEFSDEAFETILEQAVAGSIYVENTEPVTFGNYPDVDRQLGLYNEELDSIPVEKKIAVAQDLERICLEKDKRVFNVSSSSYSDGYRYVRIANSRGLNKEYTLNYCMASVSVLAAEGEDKKSGYWYHFGRDFNKIDVEMIASKAVTNAIDLLQSTSPASGDYPVVLSNEMVTAIMSTFSGVFSAKNIIEGKSLLKGKIGTKVAAGSITICDDGLHPEGLSTTPFDDEGYPSGKTVLIDKGVLVNVLHNTVTAAQENALSTGNAARDIRSPLSVGKTNLILETNDNSLQAMLQSSQTVIGIVSLQGLHSGANPISGDFSLSAEGFLYENGQRIKSINNFTVSGNFLQMLKDVKMVGNDFLMSYTSCGAPSLLIDKLSIAGK